MAPSSAASWNGKFLGTGNGGYWALSAMPTWKGRSDWVMLGGSDTGHAGDDLKFAVGHPEKIDDWAWRAVHVMTETAKPILRSYYGRFAAQSYFSGCSTGGQQALTEAQRFPADYDGHNRRRPRQQSRAPQYGVSLVLGLAANKDPSSPLPGIQAPADQPGRRRRLRRIGRGQDGLIADPRMCKFDLGVLLCKGADAGDCLTASQVAAVRLSTTARETRAPASAFSPAGRAAVRAAGAATSPGSASRRAPGLLALLGLRRSGLGLPHIRFSIGRGLRRFQDGRCRRE